MDLKNNLIKEYTKYYNWDKPIPDDILEKIDRVHAEIGYGCQFADWLNHIIYALTQEFWEGGDCVDYQYFEDINYTPDIAKTPDDENIAKTGDENIVDENK
jgi:hypothetical protein